MDKNKIIKEFETSNFWKFMQFELIGLEVGTSTIQLDTRSQLENVQGILHGGAIVSLIDTSMGMTARSIDAEKVSTIQLEVRFIGPVSSGFVKATSKIIHELRNTCIIESRVTDNGGNLIALSTSTFKK